MILNFDPINLFKIMETKFNIPEISCGQCKETIESTVSNIESVVSVAVDIEQKSVAVKSTTDLNLSLVSEMLDEQGYTVVQSS